MEELATVTNLRVLGALVALLALALVLLLYRYRKVARRRRALDAALLVQRQGLRLRDHMLADADAYRLIVDPDDRIIIRAGNGKILGRDMSEDSDIDIDTVAACFVAPSAEVFRGLLNNVAANGHTASDPKTFQNLITIDGRKLRCYVSRARAHDADFLVLEFHEPSEINALEKQFAEIRQQQHQGIVAIEDAGEVAELLDHPARRRDPALERSHNTRTASQSQTLDKLYQGVALFGPDGRVKLFNPAFARLWQLPEEFLEREPHIAELLDLIRKLLPITDNWEATKASMIAQVTSRISNSNRIERPDGTKIEVSRVALPDGNKLVIHIDVTGAQEIERFLRQRNLTLEDADRVKSLFLSNISYALRTQLTSIGGFADIMTSGLAGVLDPRPFEYTELIRQAAGDLRQPIDDILDLASLDANQIDLSFRVLDLAAMSRTCIAEFEVAAQKNNLTFAFEAGPGPNKIISDAGRLRQIIQILLQNAVRYARPGGHIKTILSQTRDLIELRIEDNGIGIPQGEIERVQERFQRGSNVAHTRDLGLGLSLLTRNIERLGGSFELRSEAAMGTRAICRLPQDGPTVEPGDGPPESEKDIEPATLGTS